MRVGEPARRHGVADEDMLHAARYATRQVEKDDRFIMLLGPARNGSLLEVGVLDIESDDPVIIHAMSMRARFYEYFR